MDMLSSTKHGDKRQIFFGKKFYLWSKSWKIPQKKSFLFEQNNGNFLNYIRMTRHDAFLKNLGTTPFFNRVPKI